MVSRVTLLFVCLLIACMGADATHVRHLQKQRTRPAAAPAPPAHFKEQAHVEAASEATVKADLARTQAHLEHETKLLSMQQEESHLLLALKAKVLERERAERTLARNHLLIAQREAERLVDDLARMSQHRLLLNLQKLNKIVAEAMLPHKQILKSAKPVSIAIDSKFKQEPAAAAAAAAAASESTAAASDASAAEPTNGVESDAKKQLHKQLVAKAAEVVSAQLDGILNSEELAYIKAHNELGDTDSEETMDGEIVEEDRDARPGETPDEHYKRLSKEADALMAKAYPFIKCEGGAAGGSTGAAHGSSTGGEHHSSSPGESSSAVESSSAEESSSTGESTGNGLLEAGAATGETAGATAAAGTESGAAAPAAGGATGAETPAAAAPAEGATAAETAAAAPAQ